MDEDIEKIIQEMTLCEKASLLCGYKTMETYPIERLDIPSLVLSDGPNGLRKEGGEGDSLAGIAKTLPTTCFPTGASIASSWDKHLAYQMGKAIGEECLHYGVDVLLGPAVNIKRNPLCGRNFEYLSEDPLLAGYIGAGLLNGVQSNGVGACMKHYAANNLEKYRYTGDSIVDERALREIYLKPYELINKLAAPKAVMLAYNKVNGDFCSENKHLIEDILREEFSFKGITMTDWGGLYNRESALNNGCDLEMPGMTIHNVNTIIKGVKENRISVKTLDKSVRRILTLVKESKSVNRKEADFDKNYDLSVKIASKSAVLLKNNDNILPLKNSDKLLVIGGLFETMRYQGSGSSLLNPYRLMDHKNSFLKQGINYEFAMGYKENELQPDILLEDEAIAKVQDKDIILFYGGLNDYVESEGFDRDDMKLPFNQISLLNRLIKLNKKIVFVMFGGSPVELPFIDDIDAILYMVLPGEGGGEATTKLLFGQANPSGRLAESWPIKYEDVLFHDEFVSSPLELYKESLYVGYRYYVSASKQVRFPFGYGLSYSQFDYSSLKVEQEEDSIRVIFKLSNVGTIKGEEVAQLYVRKPKGNIIHPFRELIDFTKVELNPDEEEEVEMFIDKSLLKSYIDDKYVLEEGEYVFELCSNCENVICQTKIFIIGEILHQELPSNIKEKYFDANKVHTVSKADFELFIGREIPTYIPGVKPYTFETPINELNSFVGKIFKNALINSGLKQYKKACKMEDGPEKEREKKTGIFISKLMPNNCLRSLCFSSSGLLSYELAQGLLLLCNNHFIKGTFEMMKKEKLIKN